MLFINKIQYTTLSGILAIFLLSASVFAETSVIVHPSNSTSLTEKDIQKLFLSKKNKFPGGGRAVPVGLKQGNPQRDEFNAKIIKKTESQLKAYWAKVVFSGEGLPPKQFDSASDIVRLVADNPNIIGYVDSSEVNDSVKVIFRK